MKPIKAMLAGIGLLATLVAAAPFSAPFSGPPSPPAGFWLNPHRSVEVAIAPCARAQICGTIVWASAEAQQDARESGVGNLIGIRLLRDYGPTDAGGWQGQVYVPDMGRSFFSRISQVDPQHLRISGCVLHGLICKSQTWMRTNRALPMPARAKA